VTHPSASDSFSTLALCKFIYLLTYLQIAVVDNPTVISWPHQEEVRGTPRVSACKTYFIFPETSHWPTFLSLLVWVYLHSNLCSGLQKTHLFCTRVRIGRSSSFNVIQGRWFWYHSKAHMPLPVSPFLWLWSYLAPFLRYGDLLAKNCLFFLPLSHLAALLPMFLLEFRAEVNHEETRSRCYPAVKTEDRMIVAGVLTWYRNMTDGQTDRIYHS